MLFRLRPLAGEYECSAHETLSQLAFVVGYRALAGKATLTSVHMSRAVAVIVLLRE